MPVWACASEVSYGHRDFRPTPERPIGWRGDGTGRYPGATPVLSWDENSGSNVLWKIALPFGYGQPIVVGDQVLTQADPDVLYAVDANTGRILWQTSGKPVSPEQESAYRGWFAWYGWTFPTPLSDGLRVYTCAAGQLTAYSLDGKPLWSNTTCRASAKPTGVEITLSPLFAGGRLVHLGTLRERADTLFGLDPATGRELWRCGVAAERGSETAGAVMPSVARLGTTDVVVTHMGDAVRVTDGKRVGRDLFASEPPFKEVGYNLTTAVAPDGQALLRLGYRGFHIAQPGVCVELRRLCISDAAGTVVAEPVWGPVPVVPEAGGGSNYACQVHHALFSEGRWYWQGWPDLIAIDAADGRTLSWKKAPREMSGHEVWHEYPTPHMAGRHLFTGDRNGCVAVFEAPSWKLVALNRVEETWHSNPCFQGDRIYIRTLHALYCIGPTPDRGPRRDASERNGRQTH